MGIGKISTNGHWAVNGIPIYIPSEVEIEHENMVSSDSGRVESGSMLISWIRGDLVKVNMTFRHLTGDEVTFIKNLMQGKTFTFTYYDDGIKSISAYSGKCSYKEKTLALYQSEGGLYSDFKINAIEM